MTEFTRRQFLAGTAGAAGYLGLRRALPPGAFAAEDLGTPSGVWGGSEPGHCHDNVRDGGTVPPPSSRRAAQVCVVGGGLSGLAAAYRLRDTDVVLLEHLGRTGGHARRGRWRDGFRRKEWTLMKAMHMAAVALIAIAALGFLASPALAQAPAAEEPAPSWFDSYVAAGGWCGWIIVFLSFVGLALMIEHANIKRDKIVPPQLIDEIEGMFENEEYQEALELCEAEPNFLRTCSPPPCRRSTRASTR